MPHRARQARTSDRVRELAVRDHVPVFDGEEPLVDLPLEVRGHPSQIELEVEPGSLPGEVLLQLVEGVPERRRDVAGRIEVMAGR